jgi:hydroxymethylglutaryl-CoA lyase
MLDSIKIVECPRDAWQGLPSQISADAKAGYLRNLIYAGCTHIDAVSFVSPKAIPQMADSEEVLDYLDPPDDVEIIGIVVNIKGAERAIRTGAVQTLGFPHSISPQFLKRNQNQTPEESLGNLDAIGAMASKAQLDVVAYLSMAFGNPYGDPWSIGEVMKACKTLASSGIQQISLADTVGLATPEQIAETVGEAVAAHPEIEIGVHLHARPEEAQARIRAAFQAGCRRFDAAIGGLGGCPFAQDALVGNIPTETLIQVLKDLGAPPPQLGPLDGVIHENAEIARNFGVTSK